MVLLRLDLALGEGGGGTRGSRRPSPWTTASTSAPSSAIPPAINWTIPCSAASPVASASTSASVAAAAATGTVAAADAAAESGSEVRFNAANSAIPTPGGWGIAVPTIGWKIPSAAIRHGTWRRLRKLLRGVMPVEQLGCPRQAKQHSGCPTVAPLAPVPRRFGVAARRRRHAAGADARDGRRLRGPSARSEAEAERGAGDRSHRARGPTRSTAAELGTGKRSCPQARRAPRLVATRPNERKDSRKADSNL